MRSSPLRVTRRSAATGGVIAAILVLAITREAGANAPEFVAALQGRAADEWKAECATATTVGDPCDATICGANVTIEPGGSPTQRDLVINGYTYNLHDVGTERIDLAAAALLNAICAAGAGDPFAAAAGALGTQTVEIEAFMRRVQASSRPRSGGAMDVATVDLPVSVLSVGGAYERGSDSSNAFLLPFSYARNLNDSQFMRIAGSFMYGFRAGAESTPATGGSVPSLTQYALSLTPSFGMEVRKGKSTYAVGGYVPMAYSHATLEDSDVGFTAYAVGAGGIGTLTSQAGRTSLNAGVALAGRKTGGAFSLPATVLGRAVHPLSLLLDGYGGVSYGHDPVGAKAGLLGLTAGVAAGKWEAGMRGFVGAGYNAVLLGFTVHQELEGSFAVQRPAGDADDGG